MEKDYNDPRALLKKMRNGDNIQETVDAVDKQPTTQDFVKIVRKLNEELEQPERENLKTPEDQAREEENLNKDLEPFNVITEYVDLEVYNDYVFWGGIVDGYIKFKYRVPALPGEEGVTFKYDKEGFSVDDADNEPITDAIRNYYETHFFEYWSQNILQNRELK